MATMDSGLPFDRPKTAREEAAAVERSKRDAEMAALRKLRAEQGGLQSSSALSASEAARKKREEEMEEIRRLKHSENEENRKRLSAKGGGPLTTDMEAWLADQSGAKDADRKNKLEAQSTLKSHRGYHESKTDAAMDKEAFLKAQKDKVAAMKDLNLGDDNDAYPPQGEEDYDRPRGIMFKDADKGGEEIIKPKGVIFHQEEKKERSSLRGVVFKDATEEIPVKEKRDSMRVSFKNAPGEKLDVGEDEPTLESKTVSEPEPEPEPAPAPAPAPELAAAPEPAKEEVLTPAPEPAPVPEPVEVEEEKEPVTEISSPTYTRVDIKFSFGLIVRSSAADGFDDENLRDNETLRKCMDGTSKILKEQMPSAPSSEEMDPSKYPEAYYDPSLEPEVISIEEDRKGDKKETSKGNKRTLVKACFPVFLRDEAEDEVKSKRILKETKTTVFKALRAAVSGGSFLR